MSAICKLFKCKRMEELSYFRTLLQKYLYDHFPELLESKDFINTRVELAEETYSEARKAEKDVNTALELAHEQLFAGLEFSQFDYLLDIVNENFADRISENERRGFCIRLLAESYFIFTKHEIIHDRLGDSVPGKLMTELTGYIGNYLDSHGLLQ